jgi:hypothetical protein
LKNLLGLNIKKIYLSGNPFIKSNPDYKEKLFDIFLSLISIDNTDKEGNDIESTEYENSQNIFEKFTIKKNDDNKQNNSNNDENDEDEIEYNSEELDILDNEEEEEEDDDVEDNDNKGDENDDENNDNDNSI